MIKTWNLFRGGLLCGIVLVASSAQAAGLCEDSDRAGRVALRAALAVNAAGGAAAPLTREIYSLNSLPDTYAAILSYSGIQYTYRIELRSADCRVLRVELVRD